MEIFRPNIPTSIESSKQIDLKFTVLNARLSIDILLHRIIQITKSLGHNKSKNLEIGIKEFFNSFQERIHSLTVEAFQGFKHTIADTLDHSPAFEIAMEKDESEIKRIQKMIKKGKYEAKSVG